MRTELTKQEVKARGIGLPINRGAKAEYYEEGEEVFCMRSGRYTSELLVARLGYHPLLKHVCMYWDVVEAKPGVVAG